MKCPQCGLENRADARFCKQCGHSLHAHTVPSTPTPVPGTICPACGATAKPGARFCPRCGKPLTVQPAPQPSPPTPPPPSPASTQPSMRPVSQPAPTPHQSPPPLQPPYQSPPPPPPVSAEHRPSRWMLWVGLAAALLIIVAVALIAVRFGPELIGGFGEEGSTATPTPAPTASPTAEPTPLPTATSTSEPPTPTPTAEPSPIPAFDAKVTIATSAVELRVGDPLTVTVALTNTGSVTLSNLLYQLVGEPTPGLEWTSQDVVRYDGDMSPEAAGVVTFTLRASQEGNASFQAYVRMDAHTDPASAESLLSEMLTVMIAPP